MRIWQDFLSWWRADESDSNGWWRKHLTQSERLFWLLRWGRRLLRATPRDPRCKLCNAPFGGIGGKLSGLVGRSQSRKNPRFCKGCFEHAPLGGVEAEVGVLFADVRGYTALAETMPPEQVARLLNRFYAVAVDVLSGHDAVIDKLVGDEVMALFVPAFTGDGSMQKMVSAAEAVLRGVGYGSSEGSWLSLGVGVDFGPAFVGNVGSGEVKDFTAIGDVVNTASRLQGTAKAGQVIMSERVYQEVAERYPDAPRVELQLKGKSESVPAHVVEITSTA